MFCFDRLSDKGFFSPGIKTFVNPFSYQKIRGSEFLNKFSDIYVDGIFSVYLFRFLGFNISRVSFDSTSIAPLVFKWCIENNKKIAFVGSKDYEIKGAVESILEEYPCLNIIFYSSGYFESEYHRDVVLDGLANEFCPDIVVVGMGAFVQEEFLSDLVEKGFSGIGYTCGGFFHQTFKGGVSYYPAFFDKLNIRWIYRIYDEPKLFKRYFFEYPLFIPKLIVDFFKFKFSQGKIY